MTTQQGDRLSPDVEKPGRSRDSSPIFDEPRRSLSRDAGTFKVKRPLPRQDTSESLQPEFCDEEISIAVPPLQKVHLVFSKVVNCFSKNYIFYTTCIHFV
jgi:hypothetical protein